MALGYLLAPALQYEDVNGKPLVGGHIRVYRHGTTTPYVTWKDFNGDRNPVDVPLNMLGMCVLLADDSQLYDVYCYDRNGVQQWSRLNVGTIGSGSGGGGGEELSVLRCDAADLSTSGPFVFDTLSQYGEGAYVDQNGTVRLAKGTWHYDITVEVDYAPLQETAETTNLVLYTTLNRECSDFDLSYAHTGTLQLSGIAVVTEDGAPLVFGMGGMATGMTASVADFSVFEVATSGGGSWEYYEAGDGISINENVISVDTGTVQEKLTAGDGIDITDNVISVDGTFTQQQADWAQTDSSAVDYIKNKPDLSTYATQTDLSTGLATKQDVISDLATIRAGAEAGATAVQDPSYVHTDNNFTNADVTKLSGIESGAEANVQADWSQTDASADDYIKNKPTIPPGVTVDQTYNSSSTNAQSGTAVAGALATVNEVPASSYTDEGKVLTVDAQGNPGWAAAQAPISAGNGISITSNTVSAKVDGTSVTFNANGELEATVAPQVQSDWNETDPTSAAYILNKPTIPVIGTITV